MQIKMVRFIELTGVNEININKTILALVIILITKKVIVNIKWAIVVTEIVIVLEAWRITSFNFKMFPNIKQENLRCNGNKHIDQKIMSWT